MCLLRLLKATDLFLCQKKEIICDKNSAAQFINSRKVPYLLRFKDSDKVVDGKVLVAPPCKAPIFNLGRLQHSHCCWPDSASSIHDYKFLPNRNDFLRKSPQLCISESGVGVTLEYSILCSRAAGQICPSQVVRE